MSQYILVSKDNGFVLKEHFYSQPVPVMEPNVMWVKTDWQANDGAKPWLRTSVEDAVLFTLNQDQSPALVDGNSIANESQGQWQHNTVNLDDEAEI